MKMQEIKPVSTLFGLCHAFATTIAKAWQSKEITLNSTGRRAKPVHLIDQINFKRDHHTDSPENLQECKNRDRQLATTTLT